MYTKAIDLNPQSAVYFANRSFAQLRLENYGYALDDASKAIDNDRKYIKVWLIKFCIICSFANKVFALLLTCIKI